jgi:alpha-amylase/alpha-mannosidase (GH57 family)
VKRFSPDRFFGTGQLGREDVTNSLAMPQIRLVFLWHMHQPFYKDLVTGEYRLPWVRLHALKDYYGMVKLLDEFPDIRQTFNLVPSFIAQLEDYVAGTARDPFLEIAAKPARDLTPAERQFALTYLFHANPVHMIARYPRYEELWDRLRGTEGSLERAAQRFAAQDFTDLQVLSQLAWFDELFLEQSEVKALVEKGRNFSAEDQRLAIALQRELLARVLPAYAAAAAKGAIEISTSPYYHPILPLLCDTDMGGVSSPGLKLPQRRFQHPEDARLQLQRGMELHERVFGVRPRGAWPSEGSVSEEVLRIAQELGLEWLATDEGVLGRSRGISFARNAKGGLPVENARRLYRVYSYQQDGARPLYLLFRDHVLSDLIGFVYSRMPAKEAAENFIGKIKDAAAPVLASGHDATVAVILDGENAWEYYPQSGREFLRRLYAGLQNDPQIRALTVSEAIREEAQSKPQARPAASGRAAATPEPPARPVGAPVEMDERRPIARLEHLVPGSWINANFNIWIGAPEDNRSWDYLAAARDFYANAGMTATAEQRALALEEILIAEGSDWNWWYGPEHHSANDRDFDELYRKHLSNVYLALGARPPDYLAQPIAVIAARPTLVAQTAYIHPRIGAAYERYFDWIGAALCSSDRRSGAMHGKQFLLDTIRAGIDETNLYGRADFVAVPELESELRVNLECGPAGGSGVYALTLEATIENRAVRDWKLLEMETDAVLACSEEGRERGIKLAIRRNFEFQIPIEQLRCGPPGSLRLRFGLWRDRLPLDALPVEGWIELRVVPEEELHAGISAFS